MPARDIKGAGGFLHEYAGLPGNPRVLAAPDVRLAAVSTRPPRAISGTHVATEERAKALNDTLEENKSLCEIMEVRQQELEELAVKKHDVILC